MNCSWMENRILPYLDGRLKDGERRKVETHLAACAPCRARVNEFRAVSDLLGEMPSIAASQAFDARMNARIAAEPPRQAWWSLLMPSPRVAFAASLLLVLVVWTASRPADTDLYPDYAPANMGANADFRMMKDLPVLEDYDVLSNFEPLTDLPPAVQADQN